MRTLLVVAVLIFVFTMVVLSSLVMSIVHQSETPTAEKPDGYNNSAEDLAWCERIGQRNVSCPGFEKYTNSPEGKAQEVADRLAWCDEIYHQNVSCPLYGKVEVPPEVLAEQEADFLAWCESIGHRNVDCPKFNQSGGN